MSWLCLAATVLAAPPVVSTDHFANVFVGAEPIRLAVTAEAGGIELRDLAGTCLERRPVTDGTVDFGPRPPGYYEAALGEALLPLVVLVDPARRVPGDSRLGTDNAMSWLVRPDQHAAMARLLRQLGVTWVRERLSWGEVQPQPETWQWNGRTDSAVGALAAEGLQVYNIFHGVPGWSRADRDGKAPPDDLRVIYRFARALAEHYAQKTSAWEVWNEPDISFFSRTAHECAAFQKAAFLGFRAVDPQLLVLGPSMAHGTSAFADHLLANGTASYSDRWNYHIYADPSQYAARHQGFAELLKTHGAALPSWVTEAGDRVTGPDGLLGPEARRHQAAFLSRAFPQALAAGIERHFWFVFPFYRESNVGWGLFEPNQRAPFPGLAALSTATYALGRGDYSGRLTLPGEARAEAFARGDGSFAVAVWREADDPAEVALDFDWARVREAVNHVGTPLPRGQGPVRLSVGRAAVFLILDNPGDLGLQPPLRQVITPAPAPGLLAVVPRLRLDSAAVDKNNDSLRLAPGPTPVVVEVYNFGAEAVEGVARLSATGKATVSPTELPVNLPPGERLVADATLTLGDARATTLTMVVGSAGRNSTPVMVWLRADVNQMPADTEQVLELETPERWQKNAAGGGRTTIAAGAEGGVRFDFAFAAPGDNWTYPTARFDPPLDLSAFDGLRFEYRSSVADSGPIRLMLLEPGGATYMTSAGLPGSTTWRQATLLLEDLTHLGLSAPDPNGKLDRDRVAGLRFGANSKPLALTLEVRGLRAVKLPD